MAVSTATVSVFAYPKGVDNTQRYHVLRGTISVTNGTYPPGGFPLSFANLEQLKAIPFGGSSPSSTGSPFPVEMDIFSSSNQAGFGGVGPSGYVYMWDSVLGNMHIFEAANGVSNASGPLVEYGGNLDQHIVNDTIQFTAYFVRE